MATVLGNRTITNLSLSGLSLERFDFSGWEFRNLRGSEGVISYCENLELTIHDDSVESLTLEGCSFKNSSDAEIDYSKAVASLAQLIKPLKRKTGGALVALMSVDEVRDPLAWSALQKAGAAVRVGRSRSAKWELTSRGTRLLAAFNSAHAQGGVVLDELIESDVEIRQLLLRLV